MCPPPLPRRAHPLCLTGLATSCRARGSICSGCTHAGHWRPGRRARRTRSRFTAHASSCASAAPSAAARPTGGHHFFTRSRPTRCTAIGTEVVPCAVWCLTWRRVASRYRLLRLCYTGLRDSPTGSSPSFFVPPVLAGLSTQACCTVHSVARRRLCRAAACRAGLLDVAAATHPNMRSHGLPRSSGRHAQIRVSGLSPLAVTVLFSFVTQIHLSCLSSGAV